MSLDKNDIAPIAIKYVLECDRLPGAVRCAVAVNSAILCTFAVGGVFEAQRNCVGELRGGAVQQSGNRQRFTAGDIVVGRRCVTVAEADAQLHGFGAIYSAEDSGRSDLIGGVDGFLQTHAIAAVVVWKST